MPTASVKLAPGIDTTRTPALNEGGWSRSNLIRWKEGLPEKRGGWTRYHPTPQPSPDRCLWPWADLAGINHLAAGSATALSVITNGTRSDITPKTLTTTTATLATTNGSPTVTITDTGSQMTQYDSINIVSVLTIGGLKLQGYYPVTAIDADHYSIQASGPATNTNPTTLPQFTTAAGSFSIGVTLADHGLSVGSTIVFAPPCSVGGLTVSGFYTVKGVADSAHFTINETTPATTTDTKPLSFGAPRITYWYVGLPKTGPLGYGLGGYGQGGYGQGGFGSSATRPGAPITTDDWTLANFGEQLVACPHNGPIMMWSPSNGFTSASVNTNAPPFNAGILVSDTSQQIIAWGSSVLGQQDPLLIRWCDVGNPNQWTASVTNQAGSYRLPTGSKIVGACITPAQILVWTDIDLWSMSYVGYPLIYSVQKISSGCGLIAPKAFAQTGGATFWMSYRQFWVLDGSATVLPCSIPDEVFPALDTGNIAKIRGGANSTFDEAMWFYPIVGGSGENNNYVSFSTNQRVWDYGVMPRSAWTDQSILGYPIGASPNGLLYQHETSPDADGTAITAFVESGDFFLSNGQDFIFVDLVHPDIKWGTSGTVMLTLFVKDEPVGTTRAYGPYPITGSTLRVNLNCRGRIFAMRFTSSDLGSVWRLGNFQFRAASNGRR